MSANAELARLFDDMSRVLELLGENPFKVSAHAKVARILEGLTTDVATLADDVKKLTAIEGIGDGSAKKIIEFVTTGRVKEHDELMAKVPRGIFDVMKIPGLGPKTVKMLWEKANVTDIPSLKSALDAGVIENLPRMGAKTVQNIRDSLAFTEKASERIRLGQAMPIAEMIIAHLQAHGMNIIRIAWAGSLRRGKETIGDIDILASTKNPGDGQLASVFAKLPGVIKVLVSGETKCSVRLEEGVQADLRVMEDAVFGAAMMYFTGSKEHNIALRERAIRMGFRLNEYGLFKDDGEESPQKRGAKPVAGATEEEVYRKLKLPYIPPEVREDRGELSRDIPTLIEIDDIQAELHAHTTASDGVLTIDQLVEEAKDRGFHTIAITDHSKSSFQANGLDEKRLREHIEAIHEARSRHKGIAILAGSEVDILIDGRLDYDDDLLAQLDIVVASPHASLKQDPKKATERLLAAIRHPLVHILGHPTGRLINRREGLSPDMDVLIAAAVECGTAMEINANSLRLDLRDSHVRAAVEAGALIAIDTDAHGRDDFDELRYGILTARRGWLTADLCINTWSKQKLHAWLKKKR